MRFRLRVAGAAVVPPVGGPDICMEDEVALDLKDLDVETRESMLQELESELTLEPHFVPHRLSAHGQLVWPGILDDAVREGDDDSLALVLRSDPAIFNSHEFATRNGKTFEKRVPTNAAELLATSEFNTAYVRGLSARLLREGVEYVEIYRAAPAVWQPGVCSIHEGQIVRTSGVYDGHRAAYWPVVDDDAFSVPFGAGCHHSIRRLQ